MSDAEVSLAESGDSLFDDSNELDTKAKAGAPARGGPGNSGGKPQGAPAKPDASASYDEADIDDILSDDDDDGADAKAKPAAPPSAVARAASPPSTAAAAATPAPPGGAGASSFKLVDNFASGDDDDYSLSDSGEVDGKPAAATAADAPMRASVPPPAVEPSASGLANSAALSDTGDYSADGDAVLQSSPKLQEPGASDDVDFQRALSGSQPAGQAITVEGFGGGGDPAAAAERFKAMEDRRAAGKAAADPPQPIVVPDLGEVENADLDYEDEETGLELPSPLQLFLQYDTDRTGGISRYEFGQMLYDLDGLDDLDTKQAEKMNAYIAKEFDRADLNNDELVSIDEFYLYFYSTLCFKFPVVRSGVNPGADLLNIYMRFCSAGKANRSEQMQANQFAKLCMDSKLINGTTMPRAMCDVIWYRARAELESLESWKRKGNEYITPKMLYPQFLFALMYVADKRRSGFQEVVARILSNNSSKPMASSADYIIFKNTGDPKQLREFVERPRGLPRIVLETKAQTTRMRREADMAKSLGTMFKKTPDGTSAKQASAADAAFFGDADGLAVKPPDTPSTPAGAVGANTTDSGRYMMGGAVANVQTRSEFLNRPPQLDGELVDEGTRTKWGLEPKPVSLPKRGQQAFRHPESLLQVRQMSPDDLMIELKFVFERFNLWEHGYSKSSMDKVRFQKVMRDTELISEQFGGLTAEYVDKIFFRILPPSQESINFIKFVDALRLVATKLRSSLNVIVERLVLLGGPMVNGEVTMLGT